MTNTMQETGYARLSNLIASDIDLNISRSFKALNARNILYLQSELGELEETLTTWIKNITIRRKATMCGVSLEVGGLSRRKETNIWNVYGN